MTRGPARVPSGEGSHEGNPERCDRPDDPRTPTARSTNRPDPSSEPRTHQDQRTGTKPKTAVTTNTGTDREDRPRSCADLESDDCGPGVPGPVPAAPAPVGGGGGGGGIQPRFRRPEVPPMQLPPHVGVETDPSEPAVVNASPGLVVPAAEAPLAPIAMPVVAAPPPALGGGGGAPSGSDAVVAGRASRYQRLNRRRPSVTACRRRPQLRPFRLPRIGAGTANPCGVPECRSY